MGFKRLLWRTTSIGRTTDTIKNMINEHSIVGGIKRTIKEDVCEDNLIGKAIYQTGAYDGKKRGYSEASEAYESKLLEQADLFLKQQKDFEMERDQYENLLDQYEAEIDMLEGKTNKTEIENDYLKELLLKERQLRKLDKI